MRYSTCIALLIALGSTLAWAAPVVVPASQPAGETPVVLAKGDGYVVHWLKNDGVIIHTRTSDQRPTVLAMQRPAQPPRLVQAAGGVEVAAAVADKERLYVLLRLTRLELDDGHGGKAAVIPDGHLLQVFWLEDGALICYDDLNGPSPAPRLVPGGASCRETDYVFDGRKLVGTSPATRRP